LHTFKLPVPPTTNHLYLNMRGKGRVKSPQYRDWITEAGLLLNRQWGLSKIETQVTIEILVERQGKRRADISNRIKAVEDLMVSQGVLADDRLVERVEAQWCDDVDGCVVNIWELGDA
jgi:Holliday junction resolvase RusA-like endonuclease